MPLRSGGIASKIGDAAGLGTREAAARAPKPDKNWRRLSELGMASPSFSGKREIAVSPIASITPEYQLKKARAHNS